MKDEKCAHKVLKLKKKLSMDNESKKEKITSIVLEKIFSSTSKIKISRKKGTKRERSQ